MELKDTFIVIVGGSFMSDVIKQFLLKYRVSTSITTPYHPIGDGQCERFNGIIWKTIKLHVKDNGMPDSSWEDALPMALHAI